MFLRIILVLLYLFIIFLGARLMDVGISLAGATSLSLISKFISDALSLGLFDDGDHDEQQEEFPFSEKENNLFDTQHHYGKEGVLPNRLNHGNGSDAHMVDFTSYEHFVEHVEDTKASVWVVLVKPANSKLPKREKNDAEMDGCVHDWGMLSKTLSKNGIRTGMYECSKDQKFCQKFIYHGCSILLAMPAGSKPKGKIAMYLYESKNSCSQKYGDKNAGTCLLTWIKMKLKSKVIMLESFEELNFVFKQTKRAKKHFGLNLIYQSAQKSPPLLFSALSVRFTGRIKFIQFKSSQKSSDETKYYHGKKGLEIISVKSNSYYGYYDYGLKQGEEFEYSNIEMFLRTLSPEVNDIFLLTLVLINMACFLEIFVQKGGPLRRIIFFSWTFVISNSTLFFLWLPMTRLLQLPQAKPVIDICLESLQAAMFSNIASIVRKDMLLVSHHFDMFCIGFLVYGVIIGCMKIKLLYRASSLPNSYALWQEDMSELHQFFNSLMDLASPSLSYYNFEEQLENLLHHLARPGLWLHHMDYTDYVQQLACWQFCKNLNVPDENLCQKETDSSSIIASKKTKYCNCQFNKYQSESTVIHSSECIICLEEFQCGDPVKLLPCKHYFHKYCIESWLLFGHTAKNRRCPICRWPANRK